MMSQYHQEQYYGQPGTDPYQQQPAKTSGMAITALVCSLIGIIPCCGIITAPLGVLLGLIAIIRIGGNPAMKGKGLSVAAILIGILMIGWNIAFGYWAYNKWVRDLIEGPRDAMAAASSGDIAGFKNHFVGAGATATDEEARAFIEELENRYGEYRSISLDQSGQGPQPVTPGDTTIVTPYSFVFENQTVPGEAAYEMADEQTGQFVQKWRSITIFDPTLGDLTYPDPGDAPENGPDEILDETTDEGEGAAESATDS